MLANSQVELQNKNCYISGWNGSSDIKCTGNIRKQRMYFAGHCPRSENERQCIKWYTWSEDTRETHTHINILERDIGLERWISRP